MGNCDRCKRKIVGKKYYPTGLGPVRGRCVDAGMRKLVKALKKSRKKTR